MNTDGWDLELILSALTQATPSLTGYARSRCPFCLLRTGHEGRDGNFAFEIGTGGFRCFKCRVKGRVPVEMLPAGWGMGSLRTKLKARNLYAEYESHICEPPEGFLAFGTPKGWYHPRAQVGIRYCLDRGLSPNLIRDAGIGFVPDPDDYRLFRRVIIPIHASDGKTWMGWVGRRWWKTKDLPYLYSRGLERATTLYNSRVLLQKTEEICFIVEGSFDVLALWPHAVAVLGTYSEQQLDMMAQSRRRFVCLLDGDVPDLNLGMAWSLESRGVRVGCVRLPPDADPDEVGLDWLLSEGEKSLTLGLW